MMKPQNSSTHSIRSFRSWIAGTLLAIAFVLFVVCHMNDQWISIRNPRADMDVYSGIWNRRLINFGNYTASFRIKCMDPRTSCAKVFIARIFLLAACLASGIAAVILCTLPMYEAKYKAILCRAGLYLAILSFILGIIGSVSGLLWVFKDTQSNMISTAAISVIIGSFLSFISAVCVYIINLNEST